ncbi:MAG: hypothetical protein E2P02_01055 [Acidobacteria bacterium]|nr:MAG: hypothetical protein E2P02_01055 [Acidobacteriota bacterium]
MSLTDEPLAERVARFAHRHAIRATTPMVGDASNRAYFRVELESGETRVLALLPEAFTQRELPFLNVAELLRAMPIRVPEVMEVSGSEGILLLEDLGDRLLQDAAEESSDTCKRELYRKAIEMLATLQLRGKELENERYLPFRIVLDEAKFFQELEFFREHFIEGLREALLPSIELEELECFFRVIAKELTTKPEALCHRDYHARNLMLFSGELVLIDFQDARRGPMAYDLVSLLNDSYVTHEPDFVGEMTALFEDRVGATVLEDYDIAALQRNLKALGTFGYQISRRGNDVYERYLEHTVAMVRENFERNPRWDALRRILARYEKGLG